MKIYLDAGHNYSGFDTGAQGNGLREQDITFSVTKKLGEMLIKAGFEILYSRVNLTDNVGTNLSSSINNRYKAANEWGADYFISIHCNSSASPQANGTETLVASATSKADGLARLVNANLAALGLTDRGVKVRDNLGVLKHTLMPAILIELAFISNEGDAHFLAHRQDELADAVYQAILSFTGVFAPQEHWASEYYDYLISHGIEILEKRFDDPISRGEAFKIFAQLLKNRKA
ncbi:MAG: N-acetylmuramoyl-L-alanine amidase LytC precursor [Firmicutes bacterium ADurb.Bin193]|nr:MAG: N-acetylmuramoyl-L-alanine amidase LytC precursor [Firmicutes bacterium ADurb.Bin193]